MPLNNEAYTLHEVPQHTLFNETSPWLGHVG